jgi:hypothetical protein
LSETRTFKIWLPRVVQRNCVTLEVGFANVPPFDDHRTLSVSATSGSVAATMTSIFEPTEVWVGAALAAVICGQ